MEKLQICWERVLKKHRIEIACEFQYKNLKMIEELKALSFQKKSPVEETILLKGEKACEIIFLYASSRTYIVKMYIGNDLLIMGENKQVVVSNDILSVNETELLYQIVEEFIFEVKKCVCI